MGLCFSWWDGELLEQSPRTLLEAILRRIVAIGAGTQYTCDLTHLEEVRGEPNSKTAEGREASIYEQFIQGLRDLGEGCGSPGMFFVQDIFHLVSPELRCL